MRIKKAGILIIAAAITCTTPAVPAMAADTSESVQEIISDNEIDSLVSDPDKVVDIIMYVKNEAAKQDISDDQIRSLIQTAESTAGVSLSEDGASTLARNKNYYKPQKCGLFYVKFYLFLCCTELYFIFICDIMRYETQL